jgi:hypothetical protein
MRSFFASSDDGQEVKVCQLFSHCAAQIYGITSVVLTLKEERKKKQIHSRSYSLSFELIVIN